MEHQDIKFKNPEPSILNRRKNHDKINSKLDKANLNINLCKPTSISMSKTPTPYDSDSESRDSKKKKEEQ